MDSSFNVNRPQSVIPDPPKAPNHLRDILSIAGVLVSALILAFCLIVFVFQSYQVDGPSMQSTLQNGDHLIIWKVPKTLAKITGHHYIPKHGDIIVFNYSDTTGHEQLIKRVIALPGDRITIKDSVVTVYTKDHLNGYNPDKGMPYGQATAETSGNIDQTIRPNEVYVLGDHRNNSKDSRFFGPVSSDKIVGKLILRVLPLHTVTRF